MTKAEYRDLVERELERIKVIIEQKNADYTAGNDDPFANFRLSTLEGVQPPVGVMLRMQDKMQRLRAFFRHGRLHVQNEGAEDACRDIIGYSLLLLGMLREAQEQ